MINKDINLSELNLIKCLMCDNVVPSMHSSGDFEISICGECQSIVDRYEKGLEKSDEMSSFSDISAKMDHKNAIYCANGTVARQISGNGKKFSWKEKMEKIYFNIL